MTKEKLLDYIHNLAEKYDTDDCLEDTVIHLKGALGIIQSMVEQLEEQPICEERPSRRMTGAIEFLQHAKACCIVNGIDYETCTKCPINMNDCRLLILDELTDDEIAEVVREVERWYREHSSSTRDCN